MFKKYRPQGVMHILGKIDDFRINHMVLFIPIWHLLGVFKVRFCTPLPCKQAESGDCSGFPTVEYATEWRAVTLHQFVLFGILLVSQETELRRV